MKTEDFEVVEAMSQYGGGFVKSLAAAARRADSVNLERIKNAFPDYWELYGAMSTRGTTPRDPGLELD